MTTENNIEQKLKKLSEFVNSTGSVKDSVMSRIKNEKPVIVCKPRFEYLRRIKMHKTIIKFATAAAVIAVVVLFSSQLFMVQKVSAAEIIYQAIEALENLKTVYIKAQMRTPRADNFSAISLMFDFVPVEMWKSMQDDGSFKWRIEKPLRVAANNSKKVAMLADTRVAIEFDTEGKSDFAFDTALYGQLLNVKGLLENLLQMAQNHKDIELCMYSEVVEDQSLLVVELQIPASGDFSKNDYLKNKFIDTSDRKEIYYFEPDTKLLKGFKIIVSAEDKDVLVFATTQIAYNIEMNDELFNIKIPENVIWFKDPRNVATSKYDSTVEPKEVVQAFFKSCSEENWEEFLKLWPMSDVPPGIKQFLGGLEVISIGEPFRSGDYPVLFVPYEIKFKNGQIQKNNLSIRNDNENKIWQVDGGL
jgi:hypothetical protein